MSAVVVPLGPAAVNIAGVRAGDRNTITITLSSNGVAVDISGQVIASQVRRAVTDIDPPAITAECAVVDGPNGVLSIHWPGDDVRALLGTAAAWSGVWDVQLTDGGSDPVTVAAGTWGAELDVTR